MDENTTFGDLGLDSSVTQTIVSNGTTITTAVTGSTTVGEFINWLNYNGFEARVSNGMFTISGGDNVYTNDFNDTLDRLLNLADHYGNGNSYNVETRTTSAGSTSTITVTATVNTTTSSASASKSYTVTEDTTFGDLGVSSYGEIVTINVNGTEETMIIRPGTTVGDFRDWLNNNGFTASIVDGIFSIAGKDGVYIPDLNDTIDKALGLSDIYGSNAYTTRTVTNDMTETITTTNTVVTTSTVTQTETSTVSTTKTADENTAIGKISADPWKFTVSSNGTVSTITFSTTNTLGTVKSGLEAKGFTVDITDGKMTITGKENVFLVGDSSNTTTIKTGYSNSDSDRLTEQKTGTITGNTTFSELQGLGGTENLRIGIENGGTTSYVTVTGSTTLNQFFNKISSHGLSGSITDGKITITGTGNAHLVSPPSSLMLGDIAYTTNTTTSNTNSNKLEGTSEVTASASSKLGDIILADGTNPSAFDLTVNGKEYNFTSNNTIQDVINRLESDGYTVSVSDTGEISIVSSTSPVISGSLSSVLFGDAPTTSTVTTGSTSYTSNDLSVSDIQTVTTKLTNDSLLSDLGITSGDYFIYNNGVKFTAMVSEGDTIADLKETLKSFGISSGIIEKDGQTYFQLVGNGDSYIEKSNSSTASNIVDVLFPDGKKSSYNYASNLGITETTTAIVKATESTLLSDYDSKWGDGTLKSEGTLSVTVDGNNSIIRIGAGETFGSLMEKFEALGIEASLIDGKLLLQGGNHEFLINSAASSSNLLTNLGLTYSDNLGGYAASTEEVKETIERIVQKDGSVASNADMNTKLSLVNISSGTLALYRDGAKATIQINEDETFADLRSRISTAFSDVDISLNDGFLRIFSKTDGVSITAGSNIDTSNIASVLGLSTSGNEVVSARELYKVNGTSILTESGLFRRGDVTEGTFVIGNATFTIDDKTTLNNLISQINSSEEANATAFWDPIDGKLVINSRTSGAAFINIEKGTSNFTDIMGFTTTADDGTERLDTSSQELGSNAKFSINGTNFTSSSNTITSDISRIKGVTLNLKDISNGETVTITIKKNSEKVTDAMEEIVNAYNNLIENVDKEIASTGNLSDQSTLKIIRNQLRSLMTSSGYGNSVFKNLDAVGIALDAASANDVSTKNINKLHFDRDKFIEAYNKDSDALKSFLVGTEDSLGILSRVENLIESSLKSVTGYFDSAENSYSNQIKKYSDKIKKANSAVESYKARLEAKFKSMDMIISNIKNQYNSFLTNS